MVIHVSQFGSMLVSRPAGREGYLAAQAYLLSQPADVIEIDFSGVKVATPSWLDEFITPLQKTYGAKVRLLPTDNPSVVMSLATIAQMSTRAS